MDECGALYCCNVTGWASGLVRRLALFGMISRSLPRCGAVHIGAGGCLHFVAALYEFGDRMVSRGFGPKERIRNRLASVYRS